MRFQVAVEETGADCETDGAALVACARVVVSGCGFVGLRLGERV